MKKNLFVSAWELFKNGLCTTFSDALKMAWKKINLLKKLKSGIAQFSFKKVDGSIREAVGTLSSDFFSYDSKGSEMKENLLVVKYWDLESNGFRSFKIENLI